MEISDYIRLIRKWYWLVFVAAFVAGSVAFIVASRRPATYEAEVMLLVGSFIESPNPSTTDIRTGAELAQTYAIMAKTHNILRQVADQGQFGLTPGQIQGMISTSIIPSTSLLTIGVTYTDPILTADIANEVAQQLVLNSPTNLTPQQQAQIELAETEMTNLNEQIAELRRELSVIDEQFDSIQNPEERESLQNQRNVLIDQINIASSNIAQFSNTIANLRQRSNSLEIVEEARIPVQPTGINTASTTILGAMIGASGAIGIALLVEYLDDTVKTPDQIVKLLQIPVLGAIAKFGKANDDYPNRLITQNDPDSPISEAYRTIRTNLLFSGEHNKAAFIVTSAGPYEGKSVTTANIAVVMAKAGLRVLLIDADLRRPKVHTIFNLPNEVGLTTLLKVDPSHAAENMDNLSGDLRACLQDTDIPKLRVITSGFIPSNPAEALGSTLMKRWYNTFKSSSNVDVILFDTPPCLVVSDSYILGAAIDVPAVMVVHAGRTRQNAAIKAKEQFEQVDVDLSGVVLNQVDPNTPDYDGYGYGYYYYYSNNTEAPSGLRGIVDRILRRNNNAN